MPTTPTQSPESRLRRDASGLRKQRLTPHPDQQACADAMNIWRRAFNIAALADRRGRLGDKTYLNWMLGKEFGQGLKARREWPIVCDALRTYRQRRAKAPGPLRYKTERRLKGIRAAGFLEAGANEVLKAHGFHPQNVLSKRLRRSGDGLVVNILVKMPRVDHVAQAWKTLRKLYHKGKAQYVGFCPSSDGVAVVVTNNPQRVDARRSVEFYRIPVKDAVTPGMLREITSCLLGSKTLVAALDESMVPTLPPAMRSVATELRRWIRSRAAAGAHWFGTASPVWQEAQDTEAYAKTVGFDPKDLPGVLRSVRSSYVLKCPHCGAPVSVKLNPRTQVPVSETAPCWECRLAVRVDYLLATRASALVQDDWEHYGDTRRTKGLDCLTAAPSRRTSTSNSRAKKQRRSVPTRPVSLSLSPT